MTRMIAKQWIYEEKVMINSNQHMEWSHINNECNNGNDNNLEPLGEDHSSHSQRKDVMNDSFPIGVSADSCPAGALWLRE